MRIHPFYRLAGFLSFIILLGCSKSNSSKDYTSAIKATTWWGAFANTGDSTQYYSVHFNADGTFTWDQLKGTATGHWSLSGSKLTLMFDNSVEVIDATVNDNNTLTNFIDNGGNRVVKSGQLTPNPQIGLDNTVWKGTVTYPGGSFDIELDFQSGNKVILTDGVQTYQPFSYTRSGTGGAIKTIIDATFTYFAVIASDTEMKGSESTTDYPLDIRKQ